LVFGKNSILDINLTPGKIQNFWRIIDCWLLGIGENKQKGDNEGGYYEALPSQQK
jgi:hypothetical protein